MGLPAESLLPEADKAFPPTLAEVPAGERAEETFGFLPAVTAVGLLGSFAYVLATNGLSPANGASLVIGLLWCASGALFAAYEVKRRRSPTAIARREAKVGVYRAGQLVSSIGVGQVTRLYLRIGNSLQPMMLPGILIGVGGMLLVNPGKATDVRPAAAVALLLGVAAFASLVRTRFLLHHYYVPKGKRSEEILLSREDSERLFGKGERKTLW